MSGRSHLRGVSERLEGLMLFRVVIVTIFLGSAVALNADSLINLAEFQNTALLGLIVGTYLLTIAYALLSKRGVSAEPHARAQIVVDFALTTFLCLVSGGLDSLFVFLFYLVIISAAVVVGRPAALAAAGLTIASLLGYALIDLGVITVSNIYPIFRPAKVTIFRLAVNSAAAVVVAVLAGYLADRLGKTAAELARQRSDFADLKALNLNILESLSSGLVTAAEDGRIIYVNRAATEITGLSTDDIMEKHLKALFPGLWPIVDNRASMRRREAEFQTPDGRELFLGFSVSPLTDAQGERIGHIIIFQDLTDIRALEQQMRRSERLAAVGQLSAAIAHEIRNPLASISGAVEMLEGEAEDESERALMGIVIREVDRLNKLISDFLEYSRPHNLSPTPANIGYLVREVAALATSRGGLQVIMPTFDDENAWFDEQATRQIVWNLINNAAEAGATRIAFGVEFDETYCRLSIEDNGHGVPENIRDRIFEPFFTTKPRGTGLGLATIFRLMEEQHGLIVLEPRGELGGARFTLSFARGDVTSSAEQEVA